MDRELDLMMNDELKAQIEALNSREPGTEEHGHAVDDVSKLYKLNIEKVKNDAEIKQKREQAALEAKNRKREQIIAASGVVAQAALYATLFVMGLKFEETGALSSSFVRNFTNQIKLPKIGR